MPVTLNLADLAPREYKRTRTSEAEELFKDACQNEYRLSKGLMRSSVSDDELATKNIYASVNGLVHSALAAWSGHHHLTLRPEDIWFSILTQLSFYINEHAEELRSFFVAHEGQKELVTLHYDSIRDRDFGKVALQMTMLIEKNINDPELRTWIMPQFTTTTDTDRVVAAILMMGSMQKYFSYTSRSMCGIPSVTLLGERSDWASLLAKIEKIPQLGSEPEKFANLLKPVLERFVRAYDTPKDPESIDFFSRIVHESRGSGAHVVCGWLSAFMFWNEKGKPLYLEPEPPVSFRPFARRQAGAELDGVLYHRVDFGKIPSGFASVPVKLDDKAGETHKIHFTKMLAGSIGIQASSSGMRLEEPDEYGTYRDLELEEKLTKVDPSYQQPTEQPKANGEPGLDSLAPFTGWLMYVVEDPEEVEKKKQALADKQKELESLGPTSNDSASYGTPEYERKSELQREIRQLKEAVVS